MEAGRICDGVPWVPRGLKVRSETDTAIAPDADEEGNQFRHTLLVAKML